MGAYRDNTPENLRCSFCSKGKGDVDKLVAGPQVHICNECINLCIEIIIMDAMQECIPIGDLLPSLDEVEEALLETERFRFVQGITIPPKNP